MWPPHSLPVCYSGGVISRLGAGWERLPDYPAAGRARARQAAGRRRANMAVLPEKYVFVSKKCIVLLKL